MTYLTILAINFTQILLISVHPARSAINCDVCEGGKAGVPNLMMF